jgi:hypothetical protein
MAIAQFGLAEFLFVGGEGEALPCDLFIGLGQVDVDEAEGSSLEFLHFRANLFYLPGT